MKALVVTAPTELRESLDGLITSALAKRCRNFRFSLLNDPKAAAKYVLRSLARRYLQLSVEVRDLETEMERLVRSVAPALLNAFGVGPNTAATLMIAAGSNPNRLRTEAAFASLWGVNPIPAGQDEPESTQPWW